MRVPLAGGGQESLLSEVGSQYLLPLFTTRDACALRLVCREFLAARERAALGGRRHSDPGQHCRLARELSARALRKCGNGY